MIKLKLRKSLITFITLIIFTQIPLVVTNYYLKFNNELIIRVNINGEISHYISKEYIKRLHNTIQDKLDEYIFDKFNVNKKFNNFKIKFKSKKIVDLKQLNNELTNLINITSKKAIKNEIEKNDFVISKILNSNIDTKLIESETFSELYINNLNLNFLSDQINNKMIKLSQNQIISNGVRIVTYEERIIILLVTLVISFFIFYKDNMVLFKKLFNKVNYKKNKNKRQNYS